MASRVALLVVPMGVAMSGGMAMTGVASDRRRWMVVTPLPGVTRPRSMPTAAQHAMGQDGQAQQVGQKRAHE
jgi:hypothetical protein